MPALMGESKLHRLFHAIAIPLKYYEGTREGGLALAESPVPLGSHRSNSHGASHLLRLPIGKCIMVS